MEIEREKQELFTAVEGAPANKIEDILKEKKHEMEVKKTTEQGLPPPVKKILKKFNFEADPELVAMIDEIKSLLSHTCPSGDLAEILKKALPLAIQELKVKKGLVKRSEIKQNDIKKTNTSASKDLQHQKEKYKKAEALHNDLRHSEENPSKTKIQQENLKYQNAKLKNTSMAETVKSDERVSSMKSRSIEAQTLSPFIKNDLISQEEAKAQTSNQNDENDQASKGINKKHVSQISLNKSWKQKRITRAIPVELKRKVWKRDGGCCQYQDPQTGKRCGSKYKLEFEHTKPWSFGGKHSLENLWILCRNHNIYRWNSAKN